MAEEHVTREWSIDEKSNECLLVATLNDGFAKSVAFAWKIPHRRRFLYLEYLPANYPALFICKVQSKKELHTIKRNLLRNGWTIVKDRLPYCIRCGRGKRNDSDLCFRCNKEFQKYMKTHPLKSYASTPAGIPKMKAKSDERWNDFIESFGK